MVMVMMMMMMTSRSPLFRNRTDGWMDGWMDEWRRSRAAQRSFIII